MKDTDDLRVALTDSLAAQQEELDVLQQENKNIEDILIRFAGTPIHDPVLQGMISELKQATAAHRKSTLIIATENDKLAGVLNPAPVFTFAPGSGTVNVPYMANMSATGGIDTNYTYSISEGALPPGLALDSVTGAVTGIPTTPGNYTFKAQVTDSRTTTVGTAGGQFNILIDPQAAQPSTGTSTSTFNLPKKEVTGKSLPA